MDLTPSTSLLTGHFASQVRIFYRDDATDIQDQSSAFPLERECEQRIRSLSLIGNVHRHVESLGAWWFGGNSLQVVLLPPLNLRSSFVDVRAALRRQKLTAFDIIHRAACVAREIFSGLQSIHDANVCLEGFSSDSLNFISEQPILTLQSSSLTHSLNPNALKQKRSSDIDGVFKRILELCLGDELVEPMSPPQILADEYVSALKQNFSSDYIALFCTLRWALWAFFSPRDRDLPASEYGESTIIALPWTHTLCFCPQPRLYSPRATSYTTDIFLAKAALCVGKRDNTGFYRELGNLVESLGGSRTVTNGLYRRLFLQNTSDSNTTIGIGTYGTVLKGPFRDRSSLASAHSVEILAVKSEAIPFHSAGPSLRIVSELASNCLLKDSPNICSIEAYYMDTIEMTSVLHQWFPVAGTSLFDLVKEGLLTRPHSIFCQIVEGIVAAHTRGVYHRDLHPANVLVTQSTRVVSIIDWGFAFFTKNRSDTNPVLPIYWRPPECFGTEAKIPATIDVFGIGVCIWTTLTKNRSFFSKTVSSTLYPAHSQDRLTMRLETEQKLAYERVGERFPFPALYEDLPSDIQNDLAPYEPLLTRCLHRDPQQRPTAQECLDFLQRM